MSKPVEYIRCPRCELNYIQKKDKLCRVCKDELERIGNRDEEDELIVCPVCKTNFISPDEDMCAACAQEKDVEDGEEVVGDKHDNWRMYVENDDTETEEDDLGEMTSIVDADDLIVGDDDEEVFDDEEMEELDDEDLDEDEDDEPDDLDDIDDDLDDDIEDDDDLDEDDDF